jgi:hypothetical protein
MQTLATRRLLLLTALSGMMAAAVMAAAPLAARLHLHSIVTSVTILRDALTGPPGHDSTFYMNLGEAAFQLPDHRIYQHLFFEQHQKFIYPPSSLWLTELLDRAPLLHLSPAAALKALLIACWLGTLALGLALYRRQRPQCGWLELTCLVILGVLFMPVLTALWRGQVQTLLMFLWGVAVLLWSQRRHGWAGAVLAVTCIFKPQMAVFLLWGAARRQWRFTAVFLALLTIIEAASIAHFGLRNNLDYLPVLGYLSRHGEAVIDNQSLAGLLNRLLRNGDPIAWSNTEYPPYRLGIYACTTAFALAAIMLALWLPARARWSSTTADLLFFGCTATLISPIVWRHHYSILWFAVVYLLARAGEMTRARWVLLVLAVLAMANYLPLLDHFSGGLLSLLGDYVFFAALALLALLALEMRQRGTDGEAATG